MLPTDFTRGVGAYRNGRPYADTPEKWREGWEAAWRHDKSKRSV